MKANSDTKTWNSLEEILESTWDMLIRSASVARDRFHTPVLGTASSGGCHLRTVVLPSVIQEERILICCHTDLRSGKIREIRQNPRVSWLYHPQQKIQLRLAGQATIHTADELADQ